MPQKQKLMRRPSPNIIPMRSSGNNVRVKVRAGARKESFLVKSTHLEIAVREPAHENRANDRVRTILARHFNTTLSNVRLVAGQRSTNKRFEIIR